MTESICFNVAMRWQVPINRSPIVLLHHNKPVVKPVAVCIIERGGGGGGGGGGPNREINQSVYACFKNNLSKKKNFDSRQQ